MEGETTEEKNVGCGVGRSSPRSFHLPRAPTARPVARAGGETQCARRILTEGKRSA